MGLIQTIREAFSGAADREQRAALRSLVMREQAIRSKLAEHLYDDMENLVNPNEEWEGWNRLDDANWWRQQSGETLQSMREKMRRIQSGSGTAIGAVEAVADYIVGTGLTYDYQVPRGVSGGERAELKALRDDANAVWDDFVRKQCWTELEQALVECADYDGEFFCRMFAGENGETAVRFVAPEFVLDPKGVHRWGVVTAENDSQSVLGYIVGGETIPASQMLHFKQNVPPDVPRGIPTLWPVRDNVVRGDAITRNVAKLAAIQAAIALIRKHNFPITPATGENILNGLADATKTNVFTGKQIRQQRIEGGTIMDMGSMTDIQFPAAGVSLANFAPALLMNLRPIAVRLGLPDFAVTGDVSAANFASVFTSMAPSAKRLQRKQAKILRVMQKLHEFVRATAVSAGTLPPEAMRLDSRVTGPEVANRDEVAQTNKRDVLFRNRILSRQTWSAEEGYDAEEEAANFEADEIGSTGPGLEVPPAVPGGEGQPPGSDAPSATSGNPEIDAAVAAANAGAAPKKTPPKGVMPPALAASAAAAAEAAAKA